MRLIALITEGTQISRIFHHIGVDSEPPHICLALGPPLWEDCGVVQMDDRAQIEPADWDLVAQPSPDIEALRGRPARSTANESAVRHILVAARPGITL